MTNKELKEIAHAIVWNVWEGKKTYQFPKGFKVTPDEDKLLANYIKEESDKLLTMLEAERKQQEAEWKQQEAKWKQREADRYTNRYNVFPIGEA
jgi:hypothetical protein